MAALFEKYHLKSYNPSPDYVPSELVMFDQTTGYPSFEELEEILQFYLDHEIILISLTIAGGDMERIPDLISSFKHLELLEIYNTTLKTLPASLEDLKNLKLLAFYGEHIPAAQYDLSKLESLQFATIKTSDIP